MDGYVRALAVDGSGNLYAGGAFTTADGKVTGYVARWRTNTALLCDFDGDGKCDILWQHTSGLIYVWYMDGATLKSTVELGSVSGAGWKVAGMGDYDGNGQADIFFRNTTTGENLVWLRVGSTTNAYTLSNLDIAWKVAGYTLQYIRDTAATANQATMTVQQPPAAEVMRLQAPSWRTVQLAPKSGEAVQRILEPKK
jgi:hypothetical protein